MKVALVCNEYPPAAAGGIGTWTQAFARALAARGDVVWVIGVYRQPADSQDLDHGVRIVRLAGSRLPKWRALADRLRVRSRLLQLQRTQGLDVIEVPDYEGFLPFWPRRACPVVVRLHSLPMRVGDGTTAGAGWFERRTLSGASAVVAVSEWAKQEMMARYPGLEDVSVIPMTVAEAFLRPPHEAVQREADLVVFAGTLVERKGVWELARAWPRVKAACPAAELVFIGKDWTEAGATSSNRQVLESRLAGLDVRFVGHVTQEQLADWYRRAAVACFPSKRETFGLVAAEAMACGVPVIYTSVGPGPEVAGNGERAIVVDPDDADAIATAICDVLRSPARFVALASAGAQWVRQNLSPDATVERSRSLYHQLSAASRVR